VLGAQKAVRGATVVVYRVGILGYGSKATALGTSTSDTTGKWTVSFTKPSDDPLVYITANGGDIGNGPNSAIGLLTVVGALSGAPSQLTLNEVTTAASVYAVAQFLDTQTATQIGSAVANTAGLPNAAANVRNLVDLNAGTAYVTADSLTPMMNPVTHASEAPPGRVIDTLAEAIAACIASGAPNSTTCDELFGATSSVGGPVPTDTRQAMLHIALNPAEQTAPLFLLSQTVSGLFGPDLAAAPNDWTLAINFTGGALAASELTAIAIDAEGDAWVASQHCNSTVTNPTGCIVELSPQGVQTGPFPSAGDGLTPDLANDGGGAIAVGTNPATGQEIVWLAAESPSAIYALDARSHEFLFGGALTLNGRLRHPETVAADLLGNAWVANGNPRFLTDGTTLAGLFEVSPGAANDYSSATEFELSSPVGTAPPQFGEMALDGDNPGSIFVADQLSNRIVEFDSAAAPGVLTNLPAFVSANGSAPGPLAVDPSGNVWIADTSGGASELVKNIGAPGYVERDIGGNSIYMPGEPGGIAIDGSGNAWVANTDTQGNKGVVELTPSGQSITALTALGAYNGASPPAGGPLGLIDVGTNPLGIAIDESGNVWIATGNAGNVVQFVGAATPVRTPLNTRAARP
jgi:hypothetical protein